MNFLVHLFLSGDQPEVLVGNFMGDFVKGRLDCRPPHLFADGIVLHRKIDSFAQQHSAFHRSRLRLAVSYGLYRGAMVDLFYDHFLAVEWRDWSPVPQDQWLLRARKIVEGHLSSLPERLQKLVPFIFDELLPSYREPAGIGIALDRMSRRVSRSNPLSGGERELVAHYEELRSDFRLFLPAALKFTETYLASLP
jgi:acyl carrier protein phosphodiesterase